MGFFKDFKRDFAQAVNELMPDKDELAGEYDDEDMVNTFDETEDIDNIDIAPEDMLENIDELESGDYSDLTIDEVHNANKEYEQSQGEDEEEQEYNSEKAYVDSLPNAEVISEHDFNDLSDIDEPASEEDVTEAASNDEEVMLDGLDEENMLEGTRDAERLDDVDPFEVESFYGNPFDMMGEAVELPDMNLQQDIEAAISKEDLAEIEDTAAETEAETEEDMEKDAEEEKYTGGLPEADRFREDVMAEVEINSVNNGKTKAMDDIFEADTTYISKKTTINGNLCSEGNLDVLGTVNGNVECEGKLIIGGSIKGDIKAGDIYANATKLEGTIVSTGAVKIGVGSIVVGNLSAASAVIAGAVHGDIDVQGPVVVDSTAVIMGNIKSRSVQINNGAVIEGFCSQCYSEINVKSFFDVEESADMEEAEKEDTTEETTTEDKKQEDKDE